MRFDWYQGTIEDHPIHVVETIRKLGDEARPADGLAKRYHYRQGWAIHSHKNGVVAHVFAGGNGGNPHALASSDATDAFVDLVRNEWPDRHLVTRMDAAEDFNEERCYDRLRPVCRKIAKRHRLSFPQYCDPLHPMAGRTQYIGSPTSDYRARLYEKGWEQVGKAISRMGMDLAPDFAGSVQMIRNEVTGEDVRPQDWTRIELQVRPRFEEARRRSASMTPEEVWACTDWARQLAADTMALNLAKIVMRTRKVSKDDESMWWMCKQFGQVLGREKTKAGSWSGLGERIGEILKSMAVTPQ